MSDNNFLNSDILHKIKIKYEAYVIKHPYLLLLRKGSITYEVGEAVTQMHVDDYEKVFLISTKSLDSVLGEFWNINHRHRLHSNKAGFLSRHLMRNELEKKQELEPNEVWEVDHIDRNTRNNTLANLRVVSSQHNRDNISLYSDKTNTGYTNIWENQNGKFLLLFQAQNENFRKTFDNLDDALWQHVLLILQYREGHPFNHPDFNLNRKSILKMIKEKTIEHYFSAMYILAEKQN